MNYCDDCINKNLKCDICIKNPKYKNLKNYHKLYKPVCPIGFTDCVYDPAYIKFYHPEWYKALYGNKTLKEASKICQESNENGPAANCWRYDNEDK